MHYKKKGCNSNQTNINRLSESRTGDGLHYNQVQLTYSGRFLGSFSGRYRNHSLPRNEGQQLS